MDDEKLQRTIDFILNNQAQFSADVQILQQSNLEAEKRMSKLEKAMVGTFALSTENTQNIKKLTEDVEKLRLTQSETSEQLRETNERLNAVILRVERYLSRENGKS